MSSSASTPGSGDRVALDTSVAIDVLAAKVDQHPRLTLYGPPAISTVLFRPAGAGDDDVAALRRRLLYEGRAVLGRARAGGRLWLKATLLNPHLRPEDLDTLLALAAGPPPHTTSTTEGTAAHDA